jgi:heme-degrading monooxygenase HmoA
MADSFASGNWHVVQGKEEEFIERWTEFLQWTRSTQPALIGAGLIRDEGDPNHFVSFAQWADAPARNAWKNSEGFMERFSACRALCDDFKGSDYERIVTVKPQDDRTGVTG